MNRKISILITATILVALISAPVSADNHNDQDSGGVLEAIKGLADSFEDFTENWGTTTEEIIIGVLFKPFQTVAQQLVTILSNIIMHTPDVYPNPAVEEVHSDVLLVTYLLSGIGFMIAGLLYITGPVLGVSYAETRMILPRITAALIFSTVSLPLLQYGVKLSNALVYAFTPNQLFMNLDQLAGLSTALVLAWAVNSALLLVVVAMFIMRNVYIMFVASISPLLALFWSIPKTKRYADTFIAGWWTALAMAPLDMLVLKFCFAMLQGNGASIPGSISNWILGAAAFSLLILAPYQLYGASQAAIGQAYVISKGLKNRAKQAYNYKKRSSGQDTDFDLSDDEARRLKSYRRKKKRQQSSDNGFRSNWGESDD